MTVIEHYDANGKLVGTEHVETPDDVLPTDAERIGALEAKLAAVEALATRADVTAQEVARAARDAAPGQNR